MATLVERLVAFAGRVATEFNAVRTALDGKSALADVIRIITADATLLLSDQDRVVEGDSPTAITLILPNDLPEGFACILCQVDDGEIILAPESGAVLHSSIEGVRTGGQWAEAALRVRSNVGGSAAEYVVSGEVLP